MRFLLLKKIFSIIRRDCNLKKLKKMGLKIGEDCNISSNCEIDYSHCFLISIGNKVTITTKCIILAHDASMKRDLGYTKIGKVKIDDNVFIGVNSVVLPNTHIGENTIIGAGSVVCGEIKPNSVYVGAPARFVCTKEEFLNKHKKKMTKDVTFDESWTVRKNVTNEQKEKMKEILEGRIGYVE